MSGKQARAGARNRAKSMGIMAAVLLLGAFAPAAGAASFVSGTPSASATESAAAAPSVSGTSLSADDVKVKQEEATAKILKLFPALSQAEIQDTRLTDNSPDGSRHPLWEINFIVRRGNSSSGFSASVDAMTGDLRTVYLPYEMTRGIAAYPPKVTRRQALEIAKTFVAEASPSLKGQTLVDDARVLGSKFELSPLFGPVSYNFLFTTFHDGVRVNGQSLQVAVSGDGEVTSFYSNGESLDFPSSRPKVTLEEANKRLKQDLNLRLTYASSGYYGDPSPQNWYLIYAPTLPSNQLDAQTGEWMDGGGIPAVSNPPEYAELPKPAQPFTAKAVTAEEAAAKVAASADIPDGFALVSRSLQQGRNGGHDVWSLRWQNEKTAPYNGRSAEVDAATGQILSFRVDFYGPGYPQETQNNKPLPREQAFRIADEWVAANVPDIASYRRLVPPAAKTDGENESEYTTVSYQFFYQGIPVQSSVLSLTLDGKGKLYNYYGQPAPDAESLRKMGALKAGLTEEQAKAQYLQAVAMELAYFRNGGYYVMPSGKYVEPAIQLAYTVVDAESKQGVSRSLDAVTGQWINLYADRSPQMASELPEDVAGHWGQAALHTLLEHGVIQPDEEGLVHPDRKVTTGEWIRMLALAVNPYLDSYGTYAASGERSKPFADIGPDSPLYVAVNRLIDRKWLEPDANVKLNPEAELTRDQLAAYLSKVTGYEKLAGKLADLPDFTRLKDAASVSHPGAAALALKLGLLTPQGDAFRPNDPVTLAQLAVVFVRMAERQNEWDRPLMQ